MTRFLKISFLLIVVLTISGCRRSAGADSLDAAEDLMWNAPDSALTVLESISPDHLSKREEKARYALLYTMALDKNHLNPTNDSLIAAAVDYYKSKDNIPRLMVASFYRGRVQQHNGRYPQALLSFYQTKELAEKADSSFWAGMACRDISDIYGSAYNRTEELTFAKKEYDFLKRSGRQPYLNYALYDIGKAYDNNGDYSKAIDIAEQVGDSAVIAQDAYLYYGALHLKAHAMIGDENYSGAYPILEEIFNGGNAEYSDSIQMCLVLAQENRLGDAVNLLDRISDEDPGNKAMVRYIIYIKSGQLNKAIKEGEYIDNVADSVLRVSMSRNLTGSLSDYFEINKRISDAELKNTQLHTLLIVIIFMVSLALIITLTLYLYRKQKHEIAQKVLLAEQLKDTLTKTKEDLNKTKEDIHKVKRDLDHSQTALTKAEEALDQSRENLSESRKEGERADEIIKFLLSSKYDLLEELIDIIRCNDNTAVAKRKIADKVTGLIEDLSIQSDKITELEKSVNMLYNNLFYDFRNDLPNLKEADYLLFLFTILQFSTSTITLLLKESKVENVYNRKRRLKDKIKALGEDKSGKYLKFIS